LGFIVKRYNSDFPYTVFAALPLVLVTGKTGKVFLWDFVYTAFPEARVLRRWCHFLDNVAEKVAQCSFSAGVILSQTASIQFLSPSASSEDD
jgi:hypothetical protein